MADEMMTNMGTDVDAVWEKLMSGELQNGDLPGMVQPGEAQTGGTEEMSGSAVFETAIPAPAAVVPETVAPEAPMASVSETAVEVSAEIPNMTVAEAPDMTAVAPAMPEASDMAAAEMAVAATIAPEAPEESDMAAITSEAPVEEETTPEAPAQEPERKVNIDEIRSALEKAREEENETYHTMRKIGVSETQQKALRLMLPEGVEALDKEQAKKRCILLLKDYYLPRLEKDGVKISLAEEFTQSEEPDQEYIEAVFMKPTGEKDVVCYNYKLDADGKSLILFEKKFDSVVTKNAEPERYVLYDDSGERELASLSVKEVEQMAALNEMVKINENYYMKAKDAFGRTIEGHTDVFTKEGFENGCRIAFGNNEQESYSLNSEGKMVKAVTNDVTSVLVEKMTIPQSRAVYESEEAARAAAESVLQENDANRKIEIFAEGTSLAEFNFIPVITTVVDLNGTIKKIGKGLGELDPSLSDEENMKKQLSETISNYLNEKGYRVLKISFDNMEADMKENAGFMNAVKTFQMKAGTVSVTYLKVFQAYVNLKQGLIRQKAGDTAPILAQLPEGSELLDVDQIDWKAQKPMVYYCQRADARATGSAKSLEAADDAAMENVILEAQRVAARGLNGGIASGIRESIAANGAVSTVMGAWPKINVPNATKEDMKITRQSVKYAYGGSCERETVNVANGLISTTTWDVKELVHIQASDPVVDRGIPSDENYDRYVKEGDESGILLFEKTDMELRKYLQDAQNAVELTAQLQEKYSRARRNLAQAQEAFDKAYDAL